MRARAQSAPDKRTPGAGQIADDVFSRENISRADIRQFPTLSFSAGNFARLFYTELDSIPLVLFHKTLFFNFTAEENDP